MDISKRQDELRDYGKIRIMKLVWSQMKKEKNNNHSKREEEYLVENMT